MALNWFPLKITRVPACPAGFWTLADEYVPGGRLLRMRVLDADEHNQPVPTDWSPAPTSTCGPDGLPSNPEKMSLLCFTALYGALIGKIGGSTGDLPDVTPGNTSPWASKRVFAVGSTCILALAPADGGPLFLTMNDHPERFSRHSGELLVSLEYYPV
jgi:hypothetical protein